ncbi:hypothetical protein H4W79_001010 [Nocardiopsis terrae]|uniref:Uncharacterized protein n=1 Tax=Nocardiopsis terrae TaxID=372655 RepID=A0ABR9HCP7_9ACTN|nr:hypothetical protein [Nocardiopsis terrae]MBE1456796.1 hypothetical protein [Nocardiopsis terrae]
MTFVITLALSNKSAKEGPVKAFLRKVVVQVDKSKNLFDGIMRFADSWLSLPIIFRC